MRAYSKKEELSIDEQKMELLAAAAKVLINDIKTISISSKTYPTVNEMAHCNHDLPHSLTHFLESLFRSKSKEILNLWAQNFVSALRPRSGPMPGQLGLALMLDHKFGSKQLIQKLHKLGYCSSYPEILKYKWSYIKHKHDLLLQTIHEEAKDDSEEIELQDAESEEETADEDEKNNTDDGSSDRSDSEISFDGQIIQNENTEVYEKFEQFVGDNVDITIRSQYGNTAFHAMGQIKITTPGQDKDGAESVIERRNFKREERLRMIQALSIKLRSYVPLKVNGLGTIKFGTLQKLQRKFEYNSSCYADVAFYASWLLYVRNEAGSTPANWKGFMKSLHRSNVKESSHIEFLPIIDQPPDSYSTVYTTLVECLQKSENRPVVITFDLPLWIKASRIVLEKKFPIVVRVGGFHALKSFLGCIGFIMGDSGLEELFKIIYPGDVSHIIDGSSYYKSLRAHFLIDAALCCFLMQNSTTNEEIRGLDSYIKKCVQEKLGADFKTKAVHDYSEKIKKVLSALPGKSRTAALWGKYHELVALVKDFIRAERMHNFELHLSTTSKMLPYYAAAGRGQYAKGLRLYLEQMKTYDLEYGALIKTFKVLGLHTVRYTDHEWSGIWTDLAIEQQLMRAVKSSGGLTGGRLRNQESAHMLWTGTLNQMALVNKSFEDAIHRISKRKEPSKAVCHGDLSKSSLTKNCEAFQKLMTWFTETVDFTDSDDKSKLISYSTGLISKTGDDEVNPEDCLNIGISLHEKLDGLTFNDKFSIKGKVNNLSYLKKTIKVNDRKVFVDSLKLFNRLVLISDRETTLEESLKFELTVVPMSLFDEHQMMRKANKSALGLYLKKMDTSTVKTKNSNRPLVVDGGWLLHQLSTYKDCNTFEDVARNYLKLIPKNHSQVIVVFDGYNPSTKDHEHLRRVKDYCSDIRITKSTTCTTVTKKKLLANSNNKKGLIELICEVFLENGIYVFKANDDADTLVASKALNLALISDVEVLAEDTDIILCLLVHHFNSEHHNNIVFTAKSGSYSIGKIASQLKPKEKRMLLLVHSFSGCDTVSGIFGYGKEKFLKKAITFDSEHELNLLLSIRAEKDHVIEAGLTFMQHIFGDKDKSLDSLRFQCYNRMVAKKSLVPARIPPTIAATTEHILRAYIQYHNWVMLDTTSLDPLEYGWELTNEGNFTPISTKAAIAPSAIQNLICCNCSVDVEQPCGNRCSCRKYGFKCLAACGRCHGESCTNVAEKQDGLEDEVEEADE